MVVTITKARQYANIANDCKYGNWSDATNKCIEYAFTAIELIELYEDRERELGEGYELLSLRDIAYLAMYIERKRCTRGDF